LSANGLKLRNQFVHSFDQWIDWLIGFPKWLKIDNCFFFDCFLVKSILSLNGELQRTEVRVTEYAVTNPLEEPKSGARGKHLDFLSKRGISAEVIMLTFYSIEMIVTLKGQPKLAGGGCSRISNVKLNCGPVRHCLYVFDIFNLTSHPATAGGMLK
jgi:hypothetical protein